MGALADRIRAAYRKELQKFEAVTVRRYYGAGSPRSKYERATWGRELTYASEEIAGTILQGDWKIIMLAEDLETGAVALPLVASDKIVVRGKEIAIVAIDDKIRRVEGVLCAYELQVRA